MSIGEEEVRYVAGLARLKLSQEEVREYQDQLGRILDSMAELESLPTEDVAPTAHVLGLTNVLREDEPRPFPDTQSLLDGAPESEGPYFKVPKVIG